MAADIGKVYPPEIQLLRKEVEVQGDLLNEERLERKTEIDHLRLQLETFKRLFEEIRPGFLKQFSKAYEQEKQNWNPELEKKDTAWIPIPIHFLSYQKSPTFD